MPQATGVRRVLTVGFGGEEARDFAQALARAAPTRAFEVVDAANLTQATRRLERSDFDAAVVDLRPEGGDDLDTIHQLVSLFPNLAVLALSEPDDDDMVGEEAIRAGAQDCLPRDADGRTLARAITHAIAREQEHQRAVQGALDRFPVGVLLVSEGGKVFLTNHAAEETLADGDGLRLRAGILRARTRDESAALQELILSATRASADLPVSVPALSLTRRPPRRPLSVVATSVRQRDLHGGRRRASIALFVADPDRETPGSDQVLGRLYGFSGSEARLAWMLMQGKGLQDCARELGVSVNTVRTHLKAVFDKTSTRRQGELIRLLVSGPAPARVITHTVMLVAMAMLAAV